LQTGGGGRKKKKKKCRGKKGGKKKGKKREILRWFKQKKPGNLSDPTGGEETYRQRSHGTKEKREAHPEIDLKNDKTPSLKGGQGGSKNRKGKGKHA